MPPQPIVPTAALNRLGELYNGQMGVVSFLFVTSSLLAPSLSSSTSLRIPHPHSSLSSLPSLPNVPRLTNPSAPFSYKAWRHVLLGEKAVFEDSITGVAPPTMTYHRLAVLLNTMILIMRSLLREAHEGRINGLELAVWHLEVVLYDEARKADWSDYREALERVEAVVQEMLKTGEGWGT